MPIPLIMATLLMANTVQAGQPPDLSGKWSGHWESQGSGHKGPLHGTFRKTDETHYRVVFRGRFLKVLPFRYKADLDVVGYQDGKVLLSGSRKLLFFGTFRYHAEATCEEFVATYETNNDHGVFIMKRPS